MADLKILIGADVTPSVEKIKSDLDKHIKPAIDGYLKLTIDLDTKGISAKLKNDLKSVQNSTILKPIEAKIVADTKQAEEEVRKFIKLQDEFKNFSVSKIDSKAIFEDGKATQDRRVQLELYNKEQQETIRLTYDYIEATNQVIQTSQSQSTNFKAQARDTEESIRSQIKIQEQLNSEYQKAQNLNIKSTMEKMTTPLEKQNSDYLQLKNYFAEMEKQSDSFLLKNKNGYDVWIEQEKKLSEAFSKRLKTKMEAEVLANKDSVKSEQNIQAVRKLQSEISRIEATWSRLRGSPEFVADLEAIKNLTGSIKDLPMEEQAAKIKEASTQLKIFKDGAVSAGIAQKSFGDKISETAERLSAYLISMVGFQMVLNNVKKALQEVKNVDASLVELQKVSNLDGSSLERFVKQAYEAGEAIGRTGQDIIDATTEFKRAGYELENSFNMAQAALVMTNVAEGIDSVAEASSSLIAVLRGFKISDSEIMSVVDKINEVSQTAPVGFSELTEGLKRVSGTLAQSGTDLSETIGLLTGGFASLRNMESVSAGLLMISQRLRGIGEDGEEIDGLAPKLQADFKRIADIDISDGNGGLRDTYDILADMAEILPTLTEEEQQYLGELAAGNNRVKVLNAILQNWKDVESAVESANQSMGSAEIENQKHLDSIEGKTQQLKSSFQEMSTSLIDSSMVKWGLDAANALTKLLTLFDSAGGKMVAFTVGVASLNAALKTPTIKNYTDNFKGFFTGLADIQLFNRMSFLGKLAVVS